MSYLALIDTMVDHPKISALTDRAFRLHIAGLCYSNRNLTDGLVPAEDVPRLVRGYQRKSLAELLEVGLWVDVMDVGKAYSIHDYLDWNKSASEVKAFQERQRANIRRRWDRP